MTADLAPGALPWQLRISLAEVNSNGPFSLYPDVERWFTVVDGAGVRLTFDGVKHPLDASSGPLRFSGNTPVHCDLVAGPTRDLNLMAARGVGTMLPCQSGVRWTSPLEQRGVFARRAGRWMVPGATALDLPAHTLLWLGDAAGLEFSFDANTGDDRGPAAWWLGFAPL